MTFEEELVALLGDMKRLPGQRIYLARSTRYFKIGLSGNVDKRIAQDTFEEIVAPLVTTFDPDEAADNEAPS